MFAGDNEDWEIDANGLYVATRAFLIRRGYCCANQCRNCPYINWRNTPAWRPVPADCVCCTQVASRAIEGAASRLAYHAEQLGLAGQDEEEHAYHRAMLAHYRLPLERWTA